MRQPAWNEDKDKRDLSRLLLSASVAGLLHLGLFALFQTYEPAPLEADYAVVDVQIISRPAPAAERIQIPSPPIKKTPIIEPPAPAPISEPKPEALPEPALEPLIEPEITSPTQTPDLAPDLAIEPRSPAPDVRPPEGQSQAIQAAPVPEGNTLIPDRWRLPIGSRISLEDTKITKGPLGDTLDCLKGFRTECADVRKSVFAEDQLSQTDLVWMASHPHSGLSDSSLYGLSESEIRERLGIPSAGQNGFMILPGIGINGPIWDALHGVNKPCNYSVGIGESGQRELRKSCDSLRPSSKDRIAFKPKIE